MMRRLYAALALAAPLITTVLAPASASAQTLFSTRGLGTPILPTDARTAALGGIGTGMLGNNLSLDNPADAAGLLRRGASATLQPIWNSAELNGEKASFGGSRFPLLRVIYPVNPRLVASLAYGAYLDQTWSVRFDGTEVLGNDTIATSDAVASTGGVAQLRFGFAYNPIPNLSVGIGAGVLTGTVDRSVTRSFEEGSDFDAFESRLSWSYRAPQLSLGARWDPRTGTRLAAGVTMAGKLKAIAEDSAAEDRTYGSSMKFTAGASTMITPLLMLTAGAARQKFPEITSESVILSGPGGGTTAGASTKDTWQFGAGLEYAALRKGNTVYPFRLGFRSMQLPYAGANEEAPKENSISIGTGFDLATDTGLPQALFDVSLERTMRDGLKGGTLTDGLKERFWRMNFTVSLFGR